MSEFETVQTWLRNSYNIGVSAEWLMACLEWIQQENQGVLPSLEELKSQVYEQWLLSDLTEIGEPVLPQDLVFADKSELISNYPLQLVSLTDIGFPLYSQKQKFLGHNNPNEEVSADKPFQPAWEPKSSRMLLLHLTDGHTQVQAMEYRRIKDLHPALPSGLKMLVSGTVLCRRGVIFLTPECVQVLGGEVDALAEQNSPLANLERAMIKNREDEGKHTKKEFSGKFIFRGVDKKLDNSQKPFIKRENSSIQRNYQPQSMLKPMCVKQETLPTMSANPVLLPLKQGPHCVSKFGQGKILNVISKVQPQTVVKQEWDNEIDYNDCFNDEMDLEEIDALDFTLARDAGEETVDETCKNFHPHIPQRGSTSSFSSGRNQTRDRLMLQNTESAEMVSVKRFGHPSHPTNTGQTVKNKHQEQNNIFSVQENEVEVFDDEISELVDVDDVSSSDDELFESVHPNKITPISHTSGRNNGFHSSKETQLPVSTETKSSIVHKQNNISNNKECSPLNPLNVRENSYMKPKSSAIMYPSSSDYTQRASIKKTEHYRTKSDLQERTSGLRSSGASQAKKQCKLSDMFSHSSLGSKSDQTLDDECIMIYDNPNSHSFSTSEKNKEYVAEISPSSVHESSDISSVRSSKFCMNISATLPNAATRTDGMCMESHIRKEQNDCQMKLSRVLVNSFPSTADCDEKLKTAGDMPFRYLSDMAKLQLPVSVTVKAYIATLTGKLNHNGGAYWSLACKINDGSASLDVSLSDTVLAELIGFTAQESMLMRQKMRTEPQLKDTLMRGISQCQQKLINISCLMEVEVISMAAVPVVKRLTPVTRQHVIELISRVERQIST